MYECLSLGQFSQFINTNFKSNIKLAMKINGLNSGTISWGGPLSRIPQNAIFSNISGYIVSYTFRS